jgi:hypothetical protein
VVSRLLVLLGALAVVAGPAAVHAADPTIFDVQLEVRDGFVAVDPAQTTLHLDRLGTGRASFDQCGLSTERVQAELIQYLNRVLQQRGRLLEQAVAPGAKSILGSRSEKDAGLADMLHLTSSWPEAEEKLRTWVAAHATDPDLQVTPGFNLLEVYKNILRDQDSALADGPLILLIKDMDDEEEIRQPFFTGRLPFALAAPITGDYRAQPTKNLAQWAVLRKNLSEDVLGALECQLWYRQRVVDRLTDYLEMRGVSVKPYRADAKPPEPEPPDQAGVSPEKPRFVDERVVRQRVLMAPDPLIAGVLLRMAPDDTESIAKALYLLLPSPDYAKVVTHPAAYLCTMQAPWKEEVDGTLVSGTLVNLQLRQAPGSELQIAHAYLTRRYLAERLRTLDAGGFTAKPSFPEEDRARRLKWTHLLIAPTGNVSTTTTVARPAGAEPPAFSDCNTPVDPENLGQAAPLVFDRGKDTVRPQTFAHETSRRDTDARRPAYEPDHPNQFRLGVEYSAGRPARVVGGYTRVGLLGNDALSGQIGYQDQVSGDVQYSQDFVAFGALGRRLQVSLRGFSDFTPDRRLSSGSNNDERRTGGEARGTLDLWRDLDGHWAQLEVGASWRESKTEHDGHTIDRTDITLFDIGLHYVKSWDGTPASGRLEVDPLLTLGYANAEYAKPAIDAHYHQFVGEFIQWEARANAITTIGGDVPQVELPTFGGEASVRGYRVDAGLARTVWAVQNEAWFPVRLDLRLPGALSSFLRRNVAVAVFGDVGGLVDSQDSFKGVKGGAGVGLRLVWQDFLTLRLDWAHAIGDQDRAPRDGAVYFTVTTRRGF